MLYSARASLIMRSRCCWAWLTSSQDGFTDVAPYGPKVTAKTKVAIAAKRQAIVNGSFHVFGGPIYDQSGKVKVSKGTTLKVLPDLYAMNWLVKGIEGSVPTG